MIKMDAKSGECLHLGVKGERDGGRMRETFYRCLEKYSLLQIICGMCDKLLRFTKTESQLQGCAL